MNYQRNCPKCNKSHIYSNKYTFNAAIKNNSYCNKCAETIKHNQKSTYKNINKNILYDYYINKQLSIQDIAKKINYTYKVIRKSLLYHNIPLRKTNTICLHKRSEETKNKCRLSKLGEKNPNFGKPMLKHVYESLQKNRPKKASEETKHKQRISRLKWLEKVGGRNPHNGKFFNKIACDYLNALNEQNGWNLQHALNGGEAIVYGYSVDGYDKYKNIVVEYDEFRHYDRNGNLKLKDIERMNRIINHINCEFYRFNEKTGILKKYN